MSWISCKLGDVCDIARGGSPRPIDKFITDDEDGINWIKIADATRSEKYIYETREKIKKEGISRSRVVSDGDLLLSNSMSFGRPYIMRTSGCIHDGWLVLSNYQKHLNIDFFYYLLSSPIVVNQFEILAQGSTVRNLNKELVSRVEIIIPPLATQQKIVIKLDAIFAEIDKATAAAEANVKNAEALFQSYLDKLFGEDAASYKKFNIKEVCIIGDGNHSSKYPKKEEMVDSGIPFIRSTNIVNGVLSDRELVYLTEEKHKELKKGHLKTGDVLITNRGEIGKIAIVDERFNNANLNSQIAWLRCNPSMINQYLLFFLLSATMKNFYSDTKTGAALQQLPIGKIEKIQIPLPSLDVQKTRCSEFLTIQQKCLSATYSYKNKLSQLSQLKQTILKQAFAGELV